jgi:CheY-like chemotaxis protein
MTDPALQSLPILIVDDVDSARAVLRDMLEEMGYQHILEATDGREALEILKKTPVQLTLCDQVMDDMSGQELLFNLREIPHLRDTPVIIVSALSHVAEVEAAMSLGASDYLIKPLSIRKLRRKVSDVMFKTAPRLELAGEELR